MWATVKDCTIKLLCSGVCFVQPSIARCLFHSACLVLVFFHESGCGVTINRLVGCLPPDSIIDCMLKKLTLIRFLIRSMPAIAGLLCPTICLKLLCFENYISIYFKNYAVQLQTVDHSVRWSMKNAASCVKRCEMQDTPSTWFSNAYCGVGSFPAPRLSEGRYEIKHIIQVRILSSMPNIKLLYSSDSFIHQTA